MAHLIETAVISGDGGSGKTMLASSLAGLFDSTVIADCDVDTSNLCLLLKPVVKTECRFKDDVIATLDRQTCSDCGRCFDVCRFHAVRREEAGEGWRYSIDPLSCQGCAVCAWACPEKAIEMKKTLTGSWFISDSEYGPFVHATLAPARKNSGKLVSIVRREAKKMAARENMRHIIIDSPAGIGCHVIAAVAGVSLAVVVTEPTVSGMHDMRRVLALMRCLGVETAGVINKHDLNPGVTREIESLVSVHGAPLLGRIPFSPEVNRALAHGRPIADVADAAVRREIEKIAGGVARLTEDADPGDLVLGCGEAAADC